jgi:hypothetical protein
MHSRFTLDQHFARGRFASWHYRGLVRRMFSSTSELAEVANQCAPLCAASSSKQRQQRRNRGDEQTPPRTGRRPWTWMHVHFTILTSELCRPGSCGSRAPTRYAPRPSFATQCSDTWDHNPSAGRHLSIPLADWRMPHRAGNKSNYV